VGLALDVALGALAGSISVKDREAVVSTIERLGARLWHDALGSVDSEGRLLLLDGLLERSHGRKPRVPLLQGIGAGLRQHELDEDMLRKAITYLAVRDARRAHAWALA
jgi:3-dehydroquinate synthase